MSLKDEGTVLYVLTTKDPDWLRNDKGYNLGNSAFPEHGINLLNIKHPDRTLEIVFSGPLHRVSIFRLPLPDNRPDANGIIVGIIWQKDLIKVYFNDQLMVSTLVPTPEFCSARLIVSGASSLVPLNAVGLLLYQISELLSIGEATSSGLDPITLDRVIKYDLEASKFQLLSSKQGSFDAIIQATKGAMSFLKENISNLNAIAKGYTDRLAEAHVASREAEARKLQAEAQFEVQRALQAQLSTLKQAAELKDYLNYNQGLSANANQMLDAQYSNAIVSITNTLINNRLAIEIGTK